MKTLRVRVRRFDLRELSLHEIFIRAVGGGEKAVGGDTDGVGGDEDDE